jgi:hypothetical protein
MRTREGQRTKPRKKKSGHKEAPCIPVKDRPMLSLGLLSQKQKAIKYQNHSALPSILFQQHVYEPSDFHAPPPRAAVLNQFDSR